MSKILGTILLLLSCLSIFGQAFEETELSLHVNKFDLPCIELGTQSVVAWKKSHLLYCEPIDDDSCRRASIPRLDFKNYAFAGLKTYVKSCETPVLRESFSQEGETLIIRLEFTTTRGCNKEYKLHHWYKISKDIITKASDVEFEEILNIIDQK